MAWFILTVWFAVSLGALPIILGNMFILPRTRRRMDALVLGEQRKLWALQREIFEETRRDRSINRLR